MFFLFFIARLYVACVGTPDLRPPHVLDSPRTYLKRSVAAAFRSLTIVHA